MAINRSHYDCYVLLIKMGGQGLCSVTADQNKILIITSQAAKHNIVLRKKTLFCGLTCD